MLSPNDNAVRSRLRVPPEVLLLGISLIAGALFLEIGVRLCLRVPKLRETLYPVEIGWKSEDYSALHRYDEGLDKWLAQPATNFRHSHQAGEYDYLINTTACDGYFIRPPCKPRQGAVYHFGDSFTFGFGIPEDATFVRKLGTARPHVNFGVAGDNIATMLAQAAVMARDWKVGDAPSVLIFHVFLGNDIKEIVDGTAKPPGSKPVEAPRGWKLPSSAVWPLLRDRVIARFKKAEGPAGPPGYKMHTVHLRFLRPRGQWEPEREGEYRTALNKITAALTGLRKAYAGRIVLSFIPPKETVLLDEKQEGVRALIGDFTAAAGPLNVELFNLLDAVPAAELPLMFFKIDTHFSPEGHARYAAELARGLKL